MRSDVYKTEIDEHFLLKSLHYCIKNNLKVWKNGHTAWNKILVDEVPMYVDRSIYYPSPPKQICCGDRLIEWGYGISSNSLGVIQASTSDNWHCANFGYDFGAAIQWLKEANHKDAGYILWSGLVV